MEIGLHENMDVEVNKFKNLYLLVEFVSYVCACTFTKRGTLVACLLQQFLVGRESDININFTYSTHFPLSFTRFYHLKRKMTRFIDF